MSLLNFKTLSTLNYLISLVFTSFEYIQERFLEILNVFNIFFMVLSPNFSELGNLFYKNSLKIL